MLRRRIRVKRTQTAMRNLIFTWQRWVGRILHFIGMNPKHSTGICGSLTCGYGKLSANGYWQYPYFPKTKIEGKVR